MCVCVCVCVRSDLLDGCRIESMNVSPCSVHAHLLLYQSFCVFICSLCGCLKTQLTRFISTHKHMHTACLSCSARTMQAKCILTFSLTRLQLVHYSLCYRLPPPLPPPPPTSPTSACLFQSGIWHIHDSTDSLQSPHRGSMRVKHPSG